MHLWNPWIPCSVCFELLEIWTHHI
jgi:hypothetical protein